MGQEQILKFLEKNKQTFFSEKELSNALGVGRSSINRCVKRLEEDDSVESIIGKSNTMFKHDIRLIKLNELEW